LVENLYYARPGKSEEVYRWRLHASAVEAKLGVPPGIVYRGPGNPSPDVIFQAEYSNLQALKSNIALEKGNQQILRVTEHMGTLLRHFEGRRYYLVRSRSSPCVPRSQVPAAKRP